MSKTGWLRARDVRAIHSLVGECRELGDDASIWREHWAAEICRLTGSCMAYTGEMAGCLQAEPQDLGVVCWGYQNGYVDQPLVEEHLERFRSTTEPYKLMRQYLVRRLDAEDDGVCLSRSLILDDRAWYRSDDWDMVYHGFGVDPVLFCFGTLPGESADKCSGLQMGREHGRPEYSDRDRELVREAHAALTTMVGGPLARFSEPSPSDLTPRVRQVLACVLEGDSDKQIAARLGMSPHTVNQHTKHIFKHFHVKGRAELLARWIRRGWGAGFSWIDPAAGAFPTRPTRRNGAT